MFEDSKQLKNAIDTIRGKLPESLLIEGTSFILHEELRKIERGTDELNHVCDMKERLSDDPRGIRLFCHTISLILMLPFIGNNKNDPRIDIDLILFTVKEAFDVINKSEISGKELVALFENPEFGNKDFSKFLMLILNSDASDLRNYKVTLSIL